MHSDVIGRVVTAKAGRDSGRLFVVIAAEGEDFVMICDGRLRKLVRPKKKKLKHLAFGMQRIDLGNMPKEPGCADAFIRRALKELGNNHNTVSEEG